MRVVFLTETETDQTRLAQLLSLARHEVSVVGDVASLQRALAAAQLVLIDGRATGFDAIDLCRQVRATHPRLAILLLTAPDDVDERVLGLEAGADDCIAQPFAPTQMVARVGALERRVAREPPPEEAFDIDDCHIDLGRAVARRDTWSTQLTALEVRLLRHLRKQAGRAVGRPELLEQVWQLSPKLQTRAVDVAVAALRRKVERDPAVPHIIRSVKGIGYSLGD